MDEEVLYEDSDVLGSEDILGALIRAEEYAFFDDEVDVVEEAAMRQYAA